MSPPLATGLSRRQDGGLPPLGFSLWEFSGINIFMGIISHNLILHCVASSGRQQETDAWSKLNVVDLSYNDLSFIDTQVLDSPLKTVR